MEIGVPKHIPGKEADAIRTGVVTFFNDAKGFGFIKDVITQESVFIHINQLSEPIKEHDKVTFEVEMGPEAQVLQTLKRPFNNHVAMWPENLSKRLGQRWLHYTF